MALGLFHDEECQRPVSDADPFVSKHTNAGEPVVTKLFIVLKLLIASFQWKIIVVSSLHHDKVLKPC